LNSVEAIASGTARGISQIPASSALKNLFQSRFSGGDKPRPYLLGETLSVGAGFIPARKG